MPHSLDAPFGQGDGRSSLVLIFGLACDFKKSACLLLHSFYNLWPASGIHTPCLLLYKSASQTPYENPSLLMANVGRFLQQNTPKNENLNTLIKVNYLKDAVCKNLLVLQYKE